MTANLLSNFSENVGLGGFTFILGMAVIFFGVLVLILAISAVGKVLTVIDEKKTSKAKEKVVEVKPEPVVEVSEEGIPEDVRVAIIAAVTAYYTESGAKNEFTVRKIKKI